MKLRESNITKLQKETFDVIILGGGINGAVSASALAAKGAKVALIDKGDFAGVSFGKMQKYEKSAAAAAATVGEASSSRHLCHSVARAGFAARSADQFFGADRSQGNCTAV